MYAFSSKLWIDDSELKFLRNEIPWMVMFASECYLRFGYEINKF